MMTPLSRRFALAACAAVLATAWPTCQTVRAFYFEQWPSNSTSTGTTTGTTTGTPTTITPDTVPPSTPPDNTSPQTPEPATVILGLIGAAGAFGWRKRRSA
jgi:hypothetical protein